ncbi:hypothetical protein CF392_16160 [Tamilnaduibacter salinus]|uniref:Uncharacterized protein n=1 Tax=Tamilnaduibacter salinus TaxID=1484056 RepID=A0A2A2HYW6_9GAMM|nr:hypothetical protein [Tamilnaduibacter salinus]PAV24459.1 hypothetical protein CF392_16160 [Tamilnaduibacter salinus]
MASLDVPGRIGSESAPEWSAAYLDHFSFQAASDDAAVEYVHALQYRHDMEYERLCGGREPTGDANAPHYLSHLYRWDWMPGHEGEAEPTTAASPSVHERFIGEG